MCVVGNHLPGLLLLLLNNKKKLFSLRSHQMRQGERERVGSGPIAASHRSYWGGDSSVFLSLSFSPFFIYIFFPSFFIYFTTIPSSMCMLGLGGGGHFGTAQIPSRDCIYQSRFFLFLSLSFYQLAFYKRKKIERRTTDGNGEKKRGWVFFFFLC